MSRDQPKSLKDFVRILLKNACALRWGCAGTKMTLHPPQSSQYSAQMLCLRLISACLMLALALPAKAEGVTVFAAASLKNALDEVTQGTDTTISYAASSTLARQVELGAPADLIITANAAWMDHLAAKDRLVPATRRDLLSNTLVLIAPSDTQFIAQANRPVHDIIGTARVAMALVDAVPAGIYGKEALISLGYWNPMVPNVIQTDNVRAALRLVAMGEVPFGIVYASDAKAEPRVQVVHQFDPGTHGPIRYPMAIVAGRDTPNVRAIWHKLQSPEAAQIFTRNGFLVLEAAQ